MNRFDIAKGKKPPPIVRPESDYDVPEGALKRVIIVKNHKEYECFLKNLNVGTAPGSGYSIDIEFDAPFTFNLDLHDSITLMMEGQIFIIRVQNIEYQDAMYNLGIKNFKISGTAEFRRD